MPTIFLFTVRVVHINLYLPKVKPKHIITNCGAVVNQISAIKKKSWVEGKLCNNCDMWQEDYYACKKKKDDKKRFKEKRS